MVRYRVLILPLLLLAACGTPTPFTCTDDTQCSGGMCVVGSCAVPDPGCESGYRFGASAGANAGMCTDQIGGVTPTGDPNEPLPNNKTFDATKYHDDITPSCAAGNGIDLMFDVVLAKPQRVYVDTLGATYSVALAVYSGACKDLGRGMQEKTCVGLSAPCDPHTKQWSDILEAGSYCVVVDQAVAEPIGMLTVRSRIGPAAKLATISSDSGETNDATTCGASNDVQLTCNAKSATEVSWFLMSCTSVRYVIDTCATPFAGYLGVLGVDRVLACAPGCSSPEIDVAQNTPGPMWIVADDVASNPCGPVSVFITDF